MFPVRPSIVGDEAMHVGIVHTPHDNGDCSSCIFGHLNGLGSVGDDHGNWQSDQFRGKLPQIPRADRPVADGIR